MFKQSKGEVLAQIERLSAEVAALRGERSVLNFESELERLSREKAALILELEKGRETQARGDREIEHKLGLHRQQIESEKKIMVAEAQAERLRAVEEAKLAVREGNLDAERARFEQEIEFRTKRFEEEAQTLRDLTGQILDRLPTVNVDRTFQTVEHIGQAPQIEAAPRNDER